jgi:DNA repair exonuclease SbcCD nuclease subunit
MFGQMVIKLSTAQSLYTKAFPVIQVSLSHFMKNSSVFNKQSMRDSISPAYFQIRATTSLPDNGGAEDADIVDGTVVVVTDVTLYAVGHVHTLDNLAKDGVGAVEVRGATLAGDDVELAGAGELSGVDVIAFACGSNGAVTVADIGYNLGLKLIVEVALAEQDAWLGMAAVGVAGLNHEAGNDAMEEQRVVEVSLDKLYKVVAMTRGLIIESQTDVAFGGLEQHLNSLCFLCCHWKTEQEAEERKEC